MQHGRVVVRTLVRSTGEQLRAAGHRVLHDLIDPRQLLLVDEGPDGDLLAKRVAHRQRAGFASENLRIFIGHLAKHDVPADGHADLALMQERTPGTGGGGRFQIRIVEHNKWALASEFERHALDVFSRQLAHSPADRRRTGEGNHAHAARLDQRLADRRTAIDEIEEARRQPRLFESACDDCSADDWRLRIGLQNDRVAERNGRRDRSHGQQQRKIPRRNDPHDTQGYAPREAQPLRVRARKDLSFRLDQQRRRVVQLIDGAAEFDFRLPANAAGLALNRI